MSASDFNQGLVTQESIISRCALNFVKKDNGVFDVIFLDPANDPNGFKLIFQFTLNGKRVRFFPHPFLVAYILTPPLLHNESVVEEFYKSVDEFCKVAYDKLVAYFELVDHNSGEKIISFH